MTAGVCVLLVVLGLVFAFVLSVTFLAVCFFLACVDMNQLARGIGKFFSEVSQTEWDGESVDEIVAGEESHGR